MDIFEQFKMEFHRFQALPHHAAKPQPGFGKRSEVRFRAAQKRAEVARITGQLRRNAHRFGGVGRV